MKTLRRIALVTETRGPHAWGIAWYDRDGELHMYKQTGRISESLDMLKIARDALLLIGHTRWATQGTPDDNRNNHPHASDDGWYVHNGTIPSYRRLIHTHQLVPRTDCDSEVIGLLMDQHSAVTRLNRCIYAANVTGERPFAMLGLWPGELVMVRKNNPLHRGETKKGIYFGSLAGGLPNAEAVPNNRANSYTISG